MAKTTKKKPKISGSLKPIEFSLLAPQAQDVFIAGNFNQWDPSSHPMKMDKKGVWKILLPLAPGQYEYKFYVDGDWQNDPNCPTCVENPFGTLNCVRILK